MIKPTSVQEIKYSWWNMLCQL